MGKSFRLKKGFDIQLVGEAAKEIQEIPASEIFAVKPPDYLGVTPKLTVKVGSEVLVGDSLFYDKKRPGINFPSPVSGEVVEIVRGAKRVVLEIRILADKEQKSSSVSLPSDLTPSSIKEAILKGNLWSIFKQRPFAKIASPEDQPKAIFVSTFNSAPLAPDLDFVISQDQAAFDKGLEILNILSEGKLNIGKHAESSLSVNVGDVHTFSGPHPAGNVGVQIHHISPVRPGDLVWHLDAQDVILLGKFFADGQYHTERIIALTGSEVKDPKYLKLKIGQSLKPVFEGISDEDVRYIQGNVLTGDTSHAEDFLSFYISQLTVIPEGAHSEFLGWLLPSTSKLSLSRTFFSWLMPKKKYDLDTNTHGEERAFVVSGQYEKVLPMNIMPVQLLKSIMAKDIERMEALGIHELAEEDLALCEFVCTSKIDVQQILREGLDLLEEEG
ncbi:Na(+)-translocating NADH-quinone reductase subunit A [Jiulongibacter sediminis]|jgi:Na+-transporting NADH:ubiquinone oxidoreductase subunit A|uniref:Na(+)-translocating NADH-quinone reductase subunit A n=1 Tax=Jiulongibacter sediminis TaxID=1605367 RepID=UPI0026EE6CD5|nr:Na(+)-translocating NADH-quinone reductase subunit A [Jiulongibacter sediminis]